MVNCVVIDDDEMMRMVLKQFISKHPDLKFVQEFSSALEAFNFVKQNEVDLIFLDLEMPEMSGMEFLETYNSLLPNIIITTSHEDFAIKAFQYNVSGYLIKPVTFNSFNKAILKVNTGPKKVINSNVDGDLVFVKKGSTIKKINTKDIFLIECIGDYVNLFTETEKFTLHMTMKQMELKFSDNQFLRVHRSYIVRIDKIEEIEDDSISFGKRIIPIGKTYKQEVISRLNFL
jgi:DNA-binding LytR/AlgR family response regulator